MKKPITLLLGLVLISFSFNSCTKTTEEENQVSSNLHVKFINDSGSQYTINTIEIRSRGLVSAENQPIGAWGSNLLTNGLTLAPGASTFFDLPIPNLHWSEYRIGVDNGGTTVMVEENPNVGVDAGYPITHWGSDDRTVSITVQYNASYDVIYVSGWSDWAGIDK
ncbi:MAG: hypothetical protein JW857_06345 [Bacteroidales bacterium]|nr:hypothetical protein [Bacteroidales bacterium]